MGYYSIVVWVCSKMAFLKLSWLVACEQPLLFGSLLAGYVIGRNCSLESFETPEVETMAFRSLNRRPLSYALISRRLTLYCSIECQMRILVRYREYQSLFGKKTCAQQKAKFSSTAEDLQVWTSPKVCTIGRFKRLLISFLNVLAKTLSSFWITWS